MSHDAVAAFHGARTVVELVVFVHEIERTDVGHASNRLFETVKELSLAVSVLARVLQRELDDLGDVQTSLNSSEVDDETPCGFVLVDRGVYAALAHGVYSFFFFSLFLYERGTGGIYPPFPLSPALCPLISSHHVSLNMIGSG